MPRVQIVKKKSSSLKKGNKLKVPALKQLLALVNVRQEYKGKPFIHKTLLLLSGFSEQNVTFKD